MKNQFLPYKIALLLKKKGFDEECFACYTSKITDDNFNQFWFSDQIWGNSDFHPNPRLCKNSHFGNKKSCTAPIHQQALDWLLEKHNLDIHAHKMWHYSYNYEEKRMETFYQVSICDFTIDREARDSHGDRIYQKYISSTLLKTYKEAIEDGITWALKHIK